MCNKAIQLLKEGAEVTDNLSSYEFKELLQELHIHQIELEMQNEELLQSNLELNKLNEKLRYTQESIEHEKEKYHDLFNSAPVAYMICNAEGNILNFNKALTELLDVEKDILFNTSFPRFSAPAFRDTYYFHIKDVIEEGHIQECEMELLREDGVSIHVYIESSFERNWNEEKLIRSVVIDITERKTAEKERIMQQKNLAQSHKMEA